MVISGGTVYTPAGPKPLDVYVTDGKIERLEAWGSASDDLRVDATGLLILPGAIDVHVHSRDPGWPEKETFGSLTQAAAAGGVTTVVDMPNTLPAVDSPEILRAKVERAQSQAVVDFALWGLLRTGSTQAAIEGLARAGAIGFKAYLGYAWRHSTRQVLYTMDLDDPDLEVPPGYRTLARLAPVVASTKLPLATHCEDPEILIASSQPILSYQDVLRARPAIAEGIAVAKVGALAEAHGMHIHIAHLSSAEGLAAIRRLAGSGSNVTVETCPQYLWLSDEDAPRLGTLLKMYPPVRTAADRAALREGLMRGQIGMVATDHAPHTDAEKLGTSLADAAPGNPGVQTLLLTCLELAREAGDLRLAVRWVSENPAKTLGIFPRKGAIQIGSDADLVLIDPNLRTVADLAWMRSKQRHTPFDGREFGFRIQSVYLRGEPVGPVRGQFVTP